MEPYRCDHQFQSPNPKRAEPALEDAERRQSELLKLEALEGLQNASRKYSENEARKSKKMLNEDIKEVRHQQEISAENESYLHMQLQKTEKAVLPRQGRVQGKKGLKDLIDPIKFPNHPMTTKH